MICGPPRIGLFLGSPYPAVHYVEGRIKPLFLSDVQWAILEHETFLRCTLDLSFAVKAAILRCVSSGHETARRLALSVDGSVKDVKTSVGNCFD